MAASFTEAIERVVSLFQATFEHPTVLRREERPDVALIEMGGDYGGYRVQLREIWRADGSRKYAYYVLHHSKVVVGFDNASDPRALHLKYGDDYPDHRLELIPHRHTEDKEAIELTDEMDCASFIAWLKENLHPVTPST
jgi:hypothetical protein